jgi:uncharacterized protein YaaN involved in tellurite resistance
MHNASLDRATDTLNEVIETLSNLAEDNAYDDGLFDSLTDMKKDLESCVAGIDAADKTLEEVENDKDDFEEKLKLLGDVDDILTDYETIESGFGNIYLKCDNENDRQLFNALLDCLKQPNVNRNELHEYLHNVPG